MLRGRRIAFDYGDVRIGVAVSDADSILSSPHSTLKNISKTISLELSSLLVEIDPVQIFIGSPALLSGKEGEAAQKAQLFSTLLAGITDVPITMIDERLSTVSAARNLREAGKSARQSKESIDMAAAVAILDFALDLEKRRS